MQQIFILADRVERWTAYAATAGIVMAVLWGVLTRYMMAKPAVWSSELSGILFTWAVFIGAATAFREGRHIKIDLLHGLLPDPARRALELVCRLLTLAFLIYAAILSYEMMIDGATRPSPVMRIPFSLVYLAPLLSFSLMAITDVLRMIGIVADPSHQLEGDVL